MAPLVLLAGVAKTSAGARLLHLENIFKMEGGERLGFEIEKRMKERKSAKAEYGVTAAKAHL